MDISRTLRVEVCVCVCVYVCVCVCVCATMCACVLYINAVCIIFFFFFVFNLVIRSSIIQIYFIQYSYTKFDGIASACSVVVSRED